MTKELPIAQGQVDVTVRGVCGSCAHRDATGHCQSEKLTEDWEHSEAEKADMLIYDYSESGGFWVGERFGCVHHTHNVKLTGDGERTLPASSERSERG